MVSSIPFKILPKDHPILVSKCQEVTPETPRLKEIIKTIRYALTKNFEENGAGLAANQIGFPYQILAINYEHEGPPRESHIDEIWINPKIIWESKKLDETNEMCLSLPNIYGPVIRPIEVKVEAFNEFFEKKIFRAKYFYSRVLQHEIDHLNGILFTDRIENKSKIKTLKRKGEN